MSSRSDKKSARQLEQNKLRNEFLLDLANRFYANVNLKSPNASYVSVELEKAEVYRLLDYAIESLRQQATLVETPPPIVVCGDIHGQFEDLLNVFLTMGIPPLRRYLFLGDYVDRGKQSLEVICLVLTYKTLYPNCVFLLRGNHETHRINSEYGFLAECNKRWSKGMKVWKRFNEAFDYLPITGLIGGKIFCMHGGLSPSLSTFNDIRELTRPIRNPVRGMVNDFLWADPEIDISGWQPSSRQTSFVFGEDVVKRMCRQLNIDLIARAHQICEDGYRFFANRRLVTIFTAPLYCEETNNTGAVMKVDERMTCSFLFFRPPNRRIPVAIV